MSDELPGTVTATPAGPITIEIDQSIDIHGSFTLNGPNLDANPGSTIYYFNWQHLSPGAPFAWGGDFVVLPNTDYFLPFDPVALGLSIGTHVVRIQCQDVFEFGQINVNSNEITIHVLSASVYQGDAELGPVAGTASLAENAG